MGVPATGTGRMIRLAPSLRRYSERDLARFIKDGRVRLDGDTLVPTISGGALLLLNNAESQPSGTTVTLGNSGGTDANAFDERVIGTNMTETFDNAHPAHGTNGFKFALTSTATDVTYVGWTSASIGSAVTRLFGAFYFYLAATAITSSIRLIQFRNGAGLSAGIGCTNGLQGFQFRNSADAAVTPLTGTILANTLYRVEFDITFSATVGAGTINVYLGDSLTVQGTSTPAATQAFGTGFDGFRAGFCTANFSSTSGDAVILDSLNLNTTGMPGPGPYTSGPPPPPTPIAVPAEFPARHFGPF
jgi:hypothetical protein